MSKDLKDFYKKLSSFVFKEDGCRYKLAQLFLDQSPTNNNALYSLQSWDREYKGEVYPSLHRLYVEMEDLAEFEFANKYFDGYQHWLEVKSCSWFKEPYSKMVAELNAKISGRSLKNMLAQVEEGTASQATLKYLADKDYIKAASVGRPSKSKKETKVEGNVYALDLNRIKNS